jgi:hypothetical protein
MVVISAHAARAEGFFQVSVMAEDYADWPIVRLLLNVGDMAAEPETNAAWDIGGPRSAYGWGPMPVRTFLPDASERRFCVDYDSGTGRLICWEIELTHQGAAIEEVRQLSVEMLRSQYNHHLWLEYEVSSTLAPPSADEPHEASVWLMSEQGNRTAARHPALVLYGFESADLADGPWAYLYAEVDHALSLLTTSYAEEILDLPLREQLSAAEGQWRASRDADCDFRINYAPISNDPATNRLECLYALTSIRLGLLERFVVPYF